MNIGHFTLIASLMLGLASLAAAQVAPLTITSTSPLPSGVVDADYSQRFEATGGTGVYTAWAVTTGMLPAGLSLNSTTGALTGTPTQEGTSTFTVRVTDSAQNTASQQFALPVWVNPPPTPWIRFISGPGGPAQQRFFDVRIGAAYPLTITGALTLAFAPNAHFPVDDPAIQFADGGRTLNFTIQAGETVATFAGTPAYQTGTVAGTITMTITQLHAGGQSYSPDPESPSYDPIEFIITRSAPVITSVQVLKEAQGLRVLIRGYSTPRDVTQAELYFTGTNLQQRRFVVPLVEAFLWWYGASDSTPYGSQFLYTQLFTVQGDINAISSVSVGLQNSYGDSGDGEGYLVYF